MIKRWWPVAILSVWGSVLIPAAGEVSAQEVARERVVLVHGLGRSKMAMWRLASRLEDAGYAVTRVGYDSIGATPQEVLAEAFAQIDACCRKSSVPVHFVGHSLGGLVIRSYLAKNEIATLGRVVLIGTPNGGTPLVDLNRDKWWMELAGAMALALGTGPDSFPSTLPAPHYPVGVIAGVTTRGAFSDQIAGADDGLVPVESTKLEGMTDFILVESSHSMMRYDADVVSQTIAFLKRGRFEHKPAEESP